MTQSSVLCCSCEFCGLIFHHVSQHDTSAAWAQEINRNVESDQSDLFDQLNYCDSTSSVQDILAFAHELDEKYAEQK